VAGVSEREEEWAVEVAPSFFMIRVLTVETVFSLSRRCSAISQLRRPSARRSKMRNS
jgi:hypothetical protein